jgi:hypothetical protein
MDDSEAGWDVGGPIDQVNITLRVSAPDLDPDTITRRLGVKPTFAARRGDQRPSKYQVIVQGVGIWLLELPSSTEWELSDAISELLRPLPDDVAVWKEIAAEAQVDVFCGLHLSDWNRGVDLSPELLVRLGERGIGLTFDIYFDGPDDEADA